MEGLGNFDAVAFERFATQHEIAGEAMCGETALFTRYDSVEEAWRIIDPILGDQTPLFDDPQGSSGPLEADRLIAEGCGWLNPVQNEAA